MDSDPATSVEDRDAYGPFRVDCPECDYGNEPGLEETAKWYKRKHRRKTGHDCEIEEVPDDDG